MLVAMQPTVHPADPESRAAPTRSVSWQWVRRATIAFAATMCAVVLAAGVDAFWLEARLDEFSVSLPDDGPGSTWLLIGSDAFPNPHTSVRFAGSRADVILLVHTGAPRTSVISVPRDLLLLNAQGGVERAALSLDSGGPQELVDGLCRSLGVAAGHVAMLTRDGFASIVDSVGGVTVQLPTPVRDPSVKLDIEESGTVHLEGAQALALVRSRHPQYLIDGTWRRLHEHAGARARARNAGAVFNALRRSADGLSSNPIRLQRVLWAVTGALRVDSGTGLTDLIGMLHGTGKLRVLPGARLPYTIAVLADERSRAMLHAAGYPDSCTPSG